MSYDVHWELDQDHSIITPKVLKRYLCKDLAIIVVGRLQESIYLVWLL